MSKKIIAGNWKLFHTPSQSVQFFDEFLKFQFDFTRYEIVFFPAAISLAAAVSAGKKSAPITFGVQNFWSQGEGAFTGENSLLAAKEVGCSWALVGHSERRTLFHETSDEVAMKTKFALAHQMRPMVCIGESLQERESGQIMKILISQLMPLVNAQIANFDLAYEPVWAIGTGKVATPEQVAEVHLDLRLWLDSHGYQKTKIVYGGSVKPENAKGLIALPNVDGFLVGGASLKASQFIDIIRSV
jgi:triosephosphate isomerase